MNPIAAIKSLLLPRHPHGGDGACFTDGVCYTYAHFIRAPKAIDVFLDRADGTQEYAGKYVPRRTCKDESGHKSQFHCSECGCRLFLTDDAGRPTLLGDGYRADVPKYCPNCGAKVVDE